MTKLRHEVRLKYLGEYCRAEGSNLFFIPMVGKTSGGSSFK